MKQEFIFDKYPIFFANRQDLHNIYNILNDATNWLENRGMFHWTGFNKYEDIEEYYSDSLILIVVDVNSLPIATIGITHKTPSYYDDLCLNIWGDANDQYVYFRKLAVISSCHGKGIATHLLRFAEMIVVDQGNVTVRLDINSSFSELKGFYSRRGYGLRGVIGDKYFFEKRVA